MRVSIVIPTFNRKSTLRQTLQACCNQDYACEVIAVDDASTDDTQEMIREEFPSVRYLRQEKNRGPAAARNRGIQETQAEIVVFTDDDCVPPRDFVSRLVDGYRRYPHVVGVGGYQEPPDDLLKTNVLARLESYSSRKIYGVGNVEVVGSYDCPAGGTNSMSYRKIALDNIGGFDETFPTAAGEDAFLKWRLAQQGEKFLFVPVKVIHLQPYRWRTFLRQQYKRGSGAVHFEYKTTGQKPTIVRIALRILKRTLSCYEHCAKMGVAIGISKTLGDVIEAYGQLQARLQRS
jgi:GT2 family glycosyltransferase